MSQTTSEVRHGAAWLGTNDVLTYRKGRQTRTVKKLTTAAGHWPTAGWDRIVRPEALLHAQGGYGMYRNR